MRHALGRGSRYARSPKEERTFDGIVFDSKPELRRYMELKAEKAGGVVVTFLRQIPFRFPDEKWWCDFMVFRADGTILVEDVKAIGGHRTEKHIRKMRSMAKYYPEFPVTEIER